MKNIVLFKKKTKILPVGQVDTEILMAINRFHYMTAAQITNLLYPNCNDNNRYSQRRLKNLTEAGYILRLNEIPTPRYGSAPRVYTLARKGRRYMRLLGYEVPPYFRPSEDIEKAFNNPFITHALESIDVLIAAVNLCRQYKTKCLRMLSERELKREAVGVYVPTPGYGGHTVTVIPDAWFQLSVNNAQPVSIALELDRGTEERKRWRRKVAALAEWTKGPYRELFDTDNLTVAVVVPNENRRKRLCEWTMKELYSTGNEALCDIFLFTDMSPVTVKPYDFFFGNKWYLPDRDEPVSILDKPVSSERLVHALS